MHSQSESKQVDHPTDLQLDYNELVDDLEEEHLKREVFTTDQFAKEAAADE